MKPFMHKQLAEGRWFELSLAEQLANIGSEYYRAIRANKLRDAERYELACDRTMELIELTVADKRWHNKPALKELCRMKEQVTETLYVNKLPDQGLQRYFDGFAMYVRSKM